MNLSAVLLVVVLLPVVMAARELASVGTYSCMKGDHLSGSYKGVCIGLINDNKCNNVCIYESGYNSNGFCNFFQCWCHSHCTTEAEAVASAPIQQ
ncbi:hypothetical protein BDA96_10G291300 [Sorghum bicolor]|uniref:Knottin scorpion toxin-like domain-containing protein n=2 Tax=Sorghum bicolor TaxID=4558 RepID=A0A921Q5U4_SORBI|nr:hypothetical protein BDA96_10G291300 [Sorghum bicolor]OQU76864.1 hypothetical protein SORBI_3010G225150 [Sorghum bicolor]